MSPSKTFNAVLTVIIAGCLIAAGFYVHGWLEEGRILRQMIERLSADSRVAEVLVTKSEYDEQSQKIKTTIKFLEYDSKGNPLAPKYFSFHGNVIQFQSLVIRFRDDLVAAGDKLRGKSAYLFMKAFVLDGEKTQEFTITKTHEVPDGYQVEGNVTDFEASLWNEFWQYAFDENKRTVSGVKNAQIEAPGTMFLPGTIYTLRIEHDGGIRIDSRPVPEILKGEEI